MPPLPPGEPGSGGGDDHDPLEGADDVDPDDVGFRPPLPPEDRLWRHPSEVAMARPRPVALRRRWRTPALAVGSGALGAVLAVAAVAALGGFEERVVERQVSVEPTDDLAGVADLVEGASPSVAALVVRRDGTQVAGSAVVLRDRYLVTDAEVVRGADDLDVVLNGGEVVPARLVGADDLTGIAVVRADGGRLVPARLGRSASLAAGARTVLVAAVADGGWHASVATGVVSAMAPRIAGADGSARYGMIVVDAPFGAGAPGGALVDADGAVVGIAATTPSGALPAHGIATPIEVAAHVAEQLIAEGRARHVWLGLHGTDLPVEDAAAAGTAGGARVEEVAADGPAARAGVAPGDVIVSVDGEPIASMAALITALRLHLPGDVVVLGVRRDGTTTEVRVDLAARDPD